MPMSSDISGPCSCVLPLFHELSLAIAGGRPLHDLMNISVRLLAGKLPGVDRIVLAMRCRKTGLLFIENGWGLSEEERHRGVYQAGEGISGQVADTGRARLVPIIANEPRFLDRTEARRTRNTTRLAFICVPIKIGTDLLGTLSADLDNSDQKALEGHLRLMEVLASFLAQAVLLQRSRNEENEALRAENRRLSAALEKERTQALRPSAIIGNSSAIRSVYSLVHTVAPLKTPVLILGESGTGKELVASALHSGSPRAHKPFIRLNCAAITESLAESEMFGHERGAFTGADTLRKGRFEEADGGSIFLDEVGELSLSLQAKLLRILQNHELQRVGGNRTITVDVRIIAATNRDLEKAVHTGAFREDLWYRLNVFPLTIPPLRDRSGDIILLADYFVEKYARRHNKAVRRLSTPAIDLLCSYHWPGNVRELENVMERAVILSNDDVIHAWQLPPSLQSAESSGTRLEGRLDEQLANVERELIIEALKDAHGHMAKAARALGVTERVMALRVKAFGLDYRLFRIKKP